MNDVIDLTAELDAAEDIVMGRTETVVTEWGARRPDLASGVFNAGSDETAENLARLIAADQEKRGTTGALVRRTVTYSPWEEIPLSTEPDPRILATPHSSLPTTKLTPQIISQPIIDDWYRLEVRYREQISSLHAHLDADHGVMVELGRIAEAAVQMLEQVNMDTGEDRELHARAVGALRARLGEIAATMREADDSAPAAAAREGEVL